MRNVKEILRSRSLVLDGGLATELERRGIDLRGPLWSAHCLMDQPQAIRELHLDYFRAGADVATSASYQASYEGFARLGIRTENATALLRRSVALAAEARDAFAAETGSHRFVAASVGCYGAFLADGSEYRGHYGLSVAQLMEWHRPRLEALIEAKPDMLACETIPCLEEAEALVRLLEHSPIPAWISFSCKDETHLRNGERFAEALVVVESCSEVIAFGVNCTAPQHVEGLLQSIQGRTTKAILAYPNSGEIWDAKGKTWLGTAAPFDLTAATRRWRELGATWIGGCCRTTPATIREIANVLRASASSRC